MTIPVDLPHDLSQVGSYIIPVRCSKYVWKSVLFLPTGMQCNKKHITAWVCCAIISCEITNGIKKKTCGVRVS